MRAVWLPFSVLLIACGLTSRMFGATALVSAAMVHRGQLIHTVTARIVGQCRGDGFQAEVFVWPTHVRKVEIRMVDQLSGCSEIGDTKTVQIQPLELRDGVLFSRIDESEGRCSEHSKKEILYRQKKGFFSFRKTCGFIPAEVIDAVDGDTLKVRAHIFPDQYVEPTLRIFGIDTPEKRKPDCEQERIKALEAESFVRDLIKHRHIFLKDISYDGFGRILSDVYLSDARNVGQIILGNQLAVIYKRNDKTNPWCPFPGKDESIRQRARSIP